MGSHVNTIAVRSADAALTIEAKGDGWVVAEKAAYPAQIVGGFAHG